MNNRTLLTTLRPYAVQRLTDLAAERNAILSAYPDLREGAPRAQRAPRRRRPRMSAAARKRISEMMKKRWKERKAGRG